MIAYNYQIAQDAGFDVADTHSKITGLEFTYTYYCELCKKFRDRSLKDNEYYDFEVSMLKYDTNRRVF
jgi:hypothetical protein